MDTKFTKGVWATDSLMVYAVGGEIVADCDFGTIEMIEEESANASLIAAAPDMYDVLIELRSSLLAMVSCGIVGELNHEYVIDKMKAIDAVLANARGEQ